MACAMTASLGLLAASLGPLAAIHRLTSPQIAMESAAIPMAAAIMPELTIVIGNKNYSSWSLRPWLALKHCDVAFVEERIPLDHLDTAARIRAYSPAGRVPVLVDGDITVWDSLAICEYLAERFPEADLWPKDVAARAMARAVSAEMHSGFAALRAELPMNIRATRSVHTSERADADIARITTAWEICRGQYGADGEWLFGKFSIADAMFAPVVLRFRTYRIDMPRVATAYMTHVLADSALQEWMVSAVKETEVIEADEAGTPV